MGPLQAAGKQQSLEEKWVDVNWEPEGHRPGPGSRQRRGPGQPYQEEMAAIDSYEGCPLLGRRGHHSVYNLHSLPW